MTDSVAEVVGTESAAARTTVPLFQARGLRNVKTHFESYTAVEWMFIVLRTGPAVAVLSTTTLVRRPAKVTS